jgi:glucose/arabinose dehydrogenase
MRASIAALIFAVGCAGSIDSGNGSVSAGDTKADGVGGSCSVPGVAHQRVFGALTFKEPVEMLQAPGDPSRFFVVEHTGAIKVFANQNNVSSASVFLDLSDRVKVIYESGMNDLAFHPAFAQNGFVFVTYNAQPQPGHTSQWRLSRFTSTDGGKTADPASEEIFIALDKDADEHNAGKMWFGDDGFLYVSVGDGGPSFDPHRFGQNNGVLFGKFLRINVDQAATNTPYSIPPSNPFAKGGGRPEIFAWGLRNPWRWSFDRANGDIWEGEVGQDGYDEINKITIGGNYGWSDKEGTHCYNRTPCGDSFYIDPVAELAHPNNGGEWHSVIGGFVYHGKSIPSLANTYVFGDFVNGNVYGLFRDPVTNQEKPLTLDSTGKSITAFGQDADGELYVLDYSFGGIYKLVSGPCSSGVVTNGPSYKFLMRAGISTQDDALSYFGSILPSPSPSALTLQNWIDQHIGTLPTFSAFYRNTMDLGFWREMTCTQNVGRGQGGCWVRNWKNETDKANGLANLGTVTMDLSPEGFTRFYVFGPGGLLQPFAILDDEGQKFVPGVCNTCHAGHYQGAGGSADLGSIFREFEPALLQARSGITQAQAEQEWFNLNQAIRTANNNVRSEAEGAPVGTDHSKQAILDYLGHMYPNNAPPAASVHDAGHIPASWIDSTDNPSLAQTKTDLFEKVVNPYCMGCHRVNALNFGDYNVFQTLSADQGGEAVIEHYIQPDPTDPDRKKTVAMPQSELMFSNLQADADAQTAVDAWVVEAQDPSVPSCKLTFVETNASFTFWGEDIWIVGDRPELGAWNPQKGIKLDGSKFPTWSGSVLLPEGVPIQYKAVAISSFNGNVVWESGNNHTMIVPSTALSSVSNDWRP